jgi:hypothetical protein
MGALEKLIVGIVGGLLGMVLSIEISYLWKNRPDFINFALWLIPIIFAALFSGYSKGKFELTIPAMIASMLSIPITIVMGLIYMCHFHGDCFR